MRNHSPLLNLPPLGLYVHVPWCERKCPYCDFNSHPLHGSIPQSHYIKALLTDLDADSGSVTGRTIHSIFIGGGTPSLLSARMVRRLLEGIRARVRVTTDCEVTLEANPGSALYHRFAAFRSAGVTRLSIGVQSFNNRHLLQLGRIHDGMQAHKAIEAAQRAGFERINIDLMYGLPQQSPEEAEQDLRLALQHGLKHLSHYQLTIEPHTAFARRPPVLPDQDCIERILIRSRRLLHQYHLRRYEISAWAACNQRCRHNLNYWRYGDYLGIGAGACAKITNSRIGAIVRTLKHRHPRVYLAAAGNDKPVSRVEVVPKERAFEFALNALRLCDGFTLPQFSRRTGLAVSAIEPMLHQLTQEGLIRRCDQRVAATALGLRFLNDVIARFLPSD